MTPILTLALCVVALLYVIGDATAAPWQKIPHPHQGESASLPDLNCDNYSGDLRSSSFRLQRPLDIDSSPSSSWWGSSTDGSSSRSSPLPSPRLSPLGSIKEAYDGALSSVASALGLAGSVESESVSEKSVYDPKVNNLLGEVNALMESCKLHSDWKRRVVVSIKCKFTHFLDKEWKRIDAVCSAIIEATIPVDFLRACKFLEDHREEIEDFKPMFVGSQK